MTRFVHRGTPPADLGSGCEAHPAPQESMPASGLEPCSLQSTAAKDGNAINPYDFSFIDLLGPLAGNY